MSKHFFKLKHHIASWFEVGGNKRHSVYFLGKINISFTQNSPNLFLSQHS